MKKAALAALLLSLPAYAQPVPALSLTNRPDGIAQEAWESIWRRSQRVGELAAKMVRGANADCIAATALDVLAWAEVDVSAQARKSPQDASLESVEKGKGSKVRRAVRRHRDDTCRGNGGPPGSASATDLEALLKWASKTQGDWMTDNPDSWRQTADAIRAAFAAGLGQAGATAEAAGAWLPIVNPCAVAPGLSICSRKQPEGT